MEALALPRSANKRVRHRLTTLHSWLYVDKRPPNWGDKLPPAWSFNPIYRDWLKDRFGKPINDPIELKIKGDHHRKVITKLASTKTLSYADIARVIVSRYVTEGIAAAYRPSDIQIITSEVETKIHNVIQRYFLAAQWDSRPPLIVLMLNPSTATMYAKDATIHKIANRAKLLNCGGYIVINIGAGRATKPENWAAQKEPIGRHNLTVIKAVLQQVCNRWRMKPVVLCAWGDNVKLISKTHPDHVDTVMKIVNKYGKPYVLQFTQSGNPKHPLYVEAASKLQPYFAKREK